MAIFCSIHARLSVLAFIVMLLNSGCLCAKPILVSETFENDTVNKKPTHFDVKVFHNRIPFSATVVAEGQKKVLRFQADSSGNTSASLFRKIVPVRDARTALELSFRYKVVGPLKAAFVVGISGLPGLSLPAVKKYVPLKCDGNWNLQKVYLPAGENFKKRKYLDFLFGDIELKKGDHILLDDILLEEIPVNVDVQLLTPRSWNLFDKIPEQTVAIRIFSRKKNIPFTVSIFKEGNKNPVLRDTLKCSGTKDYTWDFNKFPVGKYCLEVSTGEMKKKLKWVITKNPYKAESILVRNGMPYVNGKPFLILGIYHVNDYVMNIINRDSTKGVSQNVLTRQKMLESIKQRGFNLILDGMGQGGKDYYESAQKNGLFVARDIYSGSENIKKVENFPSVFGYYTIDEPLADQIELSQEVYRKCKEIDPYSPVMNCIWPDRSGLVRKRLADIGAVDKYPITGPESSVEGDAFYVSLYRKIFVEDDPTSCVLIVPQLYAADNQPNKGYEPTIQQIRAQVYTAFACGAKGVFYFSYWCPNEIKKGMSLNPKRKFWFLPESKLWNKIGGLNKELLSIQNVILLGKTCNGLKIKKRESVLYRNLILPTGERFLMIVNPTSESQGRFTVAGLNNNEKLVSIVDSSEFKSTDGKVWRVEVSGYMCGVYKIVPMK